MRQRAFLTDDDHFLTLAIKAIGLVSPLFFTQA